MRLTQTQAIEQLRPLIGSIEDIPIGWDPFNSEEEDKYVLQWVNNPENTWCSGKKQDFEILSAAEEYTIGHYARTVLLVLGVTVA